MQLTKAELLKTAKEQGYKPEILEKVYCMLDIFQQILSVPYLKERLVLKGGTALNLFCFENLPRLSVDIDLNYIGSIDKETMLEEKPIIIDAIHAILLQNQFEQDRSPIYHAGGKMVWFYKSVLGQRGSLEIDLNFMYRNSLLPIQQLSPKVFSENDWFAPVLDIHELAAGKLAALFNRVAARDLFDAHYLLTKSDLEYEKLRAPMVVYFAIAGIDVEKLTADSVKYDINNIRNRLLPVLHQQDIPRHKSDLKIWVENLVSELKEKLSLIFPLRDNELEFVHSIREDRVINPELISNNENLIKVMRQHPGLKWVINKYEKQKT